MMLKKMNRMELDFHLKTLVQKERELLHEILQVICEVDARKLFLEMGFSSLFDYLTVGVGYSQGGAQRRIDAARLLSELPEIGEKIQSGAIKMNKISMVQKAAREAAKLNSQTVRSEEKRQLLELISEKSIFESQKEIATFFDIPVVQKQETKVQADQSVRIEMTLPKEVHEKVLQAQALLSHSVPSQDLVHFLDFVCGKIIKQKTRTKAVQQVVKIKPSDEKVEKESTKSDGDRTYVNTASWSAKSFSVPQWKRPVLGKGVGCEYRDPLTGKGCNSHWFLQVDHKQPRWANGSNLEGNLQILCATHNRMKYRKESNIRIIGQMRMSNKQ